jgi:4-amino-4-deoxy-L-arabinose transferase-like glycosyltransferase
VVASVFLLALGVRLIGITQGPFVDELYHVLAAQSYLADGTLSINGGEPYTRVRAFTLLIAALFKMFGASLAVARIPAVVAGALLVACTFSWLWRLGERIAASVAAFLITLSPDAIDLSQWARFYMLQYLVLLIAAICTYNAVSKSWSRSRSSRSVAGALVAAATAVYLQRTSIIGVGGIGLFALLMVGGRVYRSVMRSRVRWWIAGAAVLAIAALSLTLAQSSVIDKAIAMASHADYWARHSTNEYRFYHWYLQNSYPTLWASFPALLLVAAAARPKMALLCACVFGTALVAHSLLAWKAVRYFYYAMPFFFVICALGIAHALPFFVRQVQSVAHSLLPHGQGRGWSTASVALMWGLVGATGLFGAMNNPAFRQTAVLLTRGHPELHQVSRFSGTIGWGPAAERLRGPLSASEVLVSSTDVSALYFLHALDYTLNLDKLYDGSGFRPEFWVDERVARPVVSSPASMRRIMECHASGLVVAPRYEWEGEMVPEETAVYVAQHAEQIPLPAEYGIVAYRWSSVGDGERAGDCDFGADGRLH